MLIHAGKKQYRSVSYVLYLPMLFSWVFAYHHESIYTFVLEQPKVLNAIDSSHMNQVSCLELTHKMPYLDQKQFDGTLCLESEVT